MIKEGRTIRGSGFDGFLAPRLRCSCPTYSLCSAYVQQSILGYAIQPMRLQFRPIYRSTSRLGVFLRALMPYVCRSSGWIHDDCHAFFSLCFAIRRLAEAKHRIDAAHPLFDADRKSKLSLSCHGSSVAKIVKLFSRYTWDRLVVGVASWIVQDSWRPVQLAIGHGRSAQRVDMINQQGGRDCLVVV